MTGYRYSIGANEDTEMYGLAQKLQLPMATLARAALIAAALFATAIPTVAQYYPPAGSNEWDSVTPESVGWNETAVPELISYLRQTQTNAFVALKDGRIVIEWYADSFAPDSTWIWYSAGKSLTAVLVGLAQQAGLLSISDTTSSYLGRWTLLSEQQENEITIRHQLTMTTGLNENNFFCTLRICLNYTADAGTRWVYHNAPYSLLRDVVETASGEDINAFTDSRLGPTIGLSGEWIESGYNNFYYSTARSAARFGLLAMSNFSWDGVPVLSDSAYVAALTAPSQDLNPSYGYLWWLNGQASFISPESPESFPGPLSPNAPPDVFVAAGSQGQFVSVARSDGLVWVRMGESPSLSYVPTAYHDEIWQHLNPVIGYVPTSTEEPIDERKMPLDVYPNPANNFTTIFGRAGERIAIYDLIGRIVRHQVVAVTGPVRIDVSGLHPGRYFIVRQSSNGRAGALLTILR